MLDIYPHGVFVLLFNLFSSIFLWAAARIELLSIFTLCLLNAINVYKMVEMAPINVVKCKKQFSRCTSDNGYIHVHYICVKEKPFAAYVKQIHLISYVQILLTVFSALVGNVPFWFIALQVTMHFHLLRRYKITLFT